MPSGYYRFPTISRDTIVFVCEDDLWTVASGGGIPRRLTSGLAETSRPTLSSSGDLLAFTSREEGQPEVYLMPADGGPARRLTFLGGTICETIGWICDDQIVFASNAGQPFRGLTYLYTVDIEGRPPQQLEVGPGRAISFGPGSSKVIGRNTNSPAWWKRYRGGRAGQIWIDELGTGEFRPLIELAGNLASPMWVNERIYFLSDHEGIGNLYSCRPGGDDLRRHSDHEDYYARNASTDGRRIVYHAGADVYLFDPDNIQPSLVDVDFRSPQTQRNRKFVKASKYLDSWSLHPKGHSIALTARGTPFTLANWEGSVLQHDTYVGSRYRLLQWLNDGLRLIGVTEVEGEESFVSLPADGRTEPTLFQDLDVGRPLALAVNPAKDQILFSNHRYELCFLDLESRKLTIIDRGRSSPIAGFDWSPDGEWAAYSVSVSPQISVLRLWQATNGETFPLSKPVLRDLAPAFDPRGRYLYFLSHRSFNPVYDNLHFDLNFPRGVQPYLFTLQSDLLSPFVPQPRAPGEKPETNSSDKDAKKDEVADSEDKNTKDQGDRHPFRIDLDGIENRVVGFPVAEGRYGRILGIKDGRVLYSRYPVEGALNRSWYPGTPPAKGLLLVYDFDEQKEETLVQGISSFDVSGDGGTLIYRAGNRLRVLKAGGKPDKDAGEKAGRKSGWIDLDRIKLSVSPAAEWRQMYHEAWRLQRDHFWTPDMSKVDWLSVRERYLPLVERVASRSEFSDLIWEMQGELGTSHSYEIGGDYRPEPRYDQGFLGASFTYDEASDGWRVADIIQGDSWDAKAESPLNKPGINVTVGDVVLAINGQRLNRDVSPRQALVNLAGDEVSLMIASDHEAEPRIVTAKALSDETPARYRQWVERNRKIVHQATEGRVGYVHVPDMGPLGYAEFHRGFLAEVDRRGLIVDVRFNGGGHVSQLILEKLARRRLGYDASRWGQVPEPYPRESLLGPVVALTNEFAGSDGDIFSHGFKMMGLGPLIGTRTWGGVIGIHARHILVDGTVTTQPEFSFWFEDVGWGVENYGTDPDIEVDNRPQDYAQGVDAQLERAIEEVKALLEANPPEVPALDDRPSLSLPRLPPRSA